MRMHSGTLLLVVFGLATSAVPARSWDEEKVPLDKLPAAVLKTVKEKFARAEIKGASKEVEDGKTTYEVELKLDGRNVDLSLKEDGTLLEVEKEIAAKDLPRKVSEAVTARYPQATMKKAEEITSGDTLSYEVVVDLGGKKSKEVVLDPSGKILKEEDGDED